MVTGLGADRLDLRRHRRDLDPSAGYGAGLGAPTLEIYGNRNLASTWRPVRSVPLGDDPLAARFAQPYGPSELTLADGSTVRETTAGPGSFERTSADGTALAPLPGWPVPAEVDDGSGTGVVLVVTTDGLVASVDLASGTSLWSTEGYDVVAVLDGLAVVQGSTRSRRATSGPGTWPGATRSPPSCSPARP